MKHYLSKFEATVRSRWNDPALCDYKGKTLKYGDLAATIAKLHLFFEEIGVEKGDRISLCARNSANWAASYLAIVSYGAVAVPILADFTPDGVQSLVDHSECEVLFTDADIWAKLDASKMPHLHAALAVADFSLLFGHERSLLAKASALFTGRTVERVREGLDAAFAERYPNGFSPADFKCRIGEDADLAVVNYTSGTTSAPKGVMLRHESFTAMVEFAQARIPCRQGDAIVSMLPMAHMYGLTFELLYPLISGAPVHYLGKAPSPTTLLAAMKEIRPYIVITVPMVMEKIYKKSLKPALAKPAVKAALAIPGVAAIVKKKIVGKLIDSFGGRVRSFIMGGAPLSPEAEGCFRKIGLPYTVGYGMTEACPLLAYEDWDKYVPGSCGKPVTFTSVRIDSADPRHIVGEIQAKGVNICSGYFKNEKATAAAFTPDGFLRTGDLGRMDARGNLFICGRSKSMILSASGQNIYPEELEAEVNRQDFVAESVVVDRGGKIVALVYFDQEAIRNAGLDEDEIAALPAAVLRDSNRRLPSYSRIAAVEPVQRPFEKTPKLSIKRFLYK